METDGTTSAPTWITYEIVNDEIIINHLSATIAGTYTFMLKGEVLYNSVATGKFRTENFTVVLYKLTAVAAVDQIYPIQGNTDSYQFTAFTCSFCSNAGFTVTYSLEGATSGSDAQSLYSAWMTAFDDTTLTITYVSNNISDKGIYDVTIKGVLDDLEHTTVTTSFKFYLVALILSPCTLSD